MDTQSNNFKHYFVSANHLESDYFNFEFTFQNEIFKFTSCNDVFSKNEIDYGSKVLIKTILKDKQKYFGHGLDIACGYGAIGVILSRFLDAEFDMCDINSLAIKLCKINAKQNNSRVKNIFESDMWQNVQDSYEFIVSNPPIKVGKKVLMDFLNNAKEHLNPNGTLTIVIKKNLGADSTKKYLTEIFGNCEVLNRDKGYYILQSINK